MIEILLWGSCLRPAVTRLWPVSFSDSLKVPWFKFNLTGLIGYLRFMISKVTTSVSTMLWWLCCQVEVKLADKVPTS
jgi:ABC-type cobalamin transport system permease subunit